MVVAMPDFELPSQTDLGLAEFDYLSVFGDPLDNLPAYNPATGGLDLLNLPGLPGTAPKKPATGTTSRPSGGGGSGSGISMGGGSSRPPTSQPTRPTTPTYYPTSQAQGGLFSGNSGIILLVLAVFFFKAR
jgi:hypothetical protein